MFKEIPCTLPQPLPLLPSYITTVQSQNQEIDIGTIHTTIQILPIIHVLISVCLYVCVHVSSSV